MFESYWNANGKYFGCTSTKSAEKVTEYVGNEFARLINDIIVLDEFSKDERNELVEYSLWINVLAISVQFNSEHLFETLIRRIFFLNEISE